MLYSVILLLQGVGVGVGQALCLLGAGVSNERCMYGTVDSHDGPNRNEEEEGD